MFKTNSEQNEKLMKKDSLLEEKKLYQEYLDLYTKSQEEKSKKEAVLRKQHAKELLSARKSAVTTIANMITMHALQDCQQPVPEDLEEGVIYFRECTNKMTLRTEPQSNWRQQREYFIKCYTKLCSNSTDIIEGTESTFNDLATEISEQLTSSVYPEIIAKQKKGNPNKKNKRGEKPEHSAAPVQEPVAVVEEPVPVVEEPVAVVEEVAAVVEEVVAQPEIVEAPVVVEEEVVAQEAEVAAEQEEQPQQEVQLNEEAGSVEIVDENSTPMGDEAANLETPNGDGEERGGRGGRVSRGGRGRGERGSYRARGEWRGRGDGEWRGRGDGEYRGRGEYRGNRGIDGEYRPRGRGEYRGRGTRGTGRPRGEDADGFMTVKDSSEVTRGRGRGRGEYRPRGEYRGARGDGEYRGRGEYRGNRGTDGEYRPRGRGEYRGRARGEYRGRGGEETAPVSKGMEYAKGDQITEIGQKSAQQAENKE